MSARRCALALCSCLWLSSALYCAAQDESLGDAARRVRAERAAKQASETTQANSAPPNSEKSGLSQHQPTHDSCVVEPSTTKATSSDESQAEKIDAIGNKKFAQGDFVGALASFRRAIALSPGEAAYHDAAGLAESRLNHHAEAIAYFQKAISLSSDYMPARENLGWEYWSTGKWAQAAEVYHEMLLTDPGYKTDVIRDDYVSALVASGREAEARVLFEKWFPNGR